MNPGIKVRDRYTLKEKIGSGGFGEVWRAHDEVLDCDVAIKIYITLDSKGVEEFKSEYTTTMGIIHPNLLTPTYFDIWENRPYLVMKYCAAGSSADIAGNMDEYDIWHFIHDVTAGLKYLHNLPEPIVHQDIKPDNILIDEHHQYVITDFGISKKIRSTMRKQSTKAPGAGATAYMAPEKFDANPSPVKASDIWSLGVSIYELATGDLPFSAMGGGMQKSGAELPSLGPQWSKELNMVMQSCLALQPWDRPAAQQLEEYSAGILSGESPTVTWVVPEEKLTTGGGEDGENPDPGPDPDPNTKRIVIAILGIVAAVILLVIIFTLPSRNNDEDIVIPEDTVDTTETVAVEVAETVSSDIPEVQPKKNEEVSVSALTKKDEMKSKKDEMDPKVKEGNKSDNKAALLKTALANGDYQQVQKLANQGYAAAYGPLAKYYLVNHNYEAAETYAKKAKAAGYREGTEVIETLRKLGYYD